MPLWSRVGGCNVRICIDIHHANLKVIDKGESWFYYPVFHYMSVVLTPYFYVYI